MGAQATNALNVTLSGGGAGLFSSLLGGNQTAKALALARTAQKGFTGSMSKNSMPKKLANLGPARVSDATVSRSFELQMDVGADLTTLAHA